MLIRGDTDRGLKRQIKQKAQICMEPPWAEVFYSLHTLELSVLLPFQGKAVQIHLGRLWLSFAVLMRAGL